MVAAVDVGTRRDIPGWMSDVLHALDVPGAHDRLGRIRSDGAHSNDIFELTFSDHRVLLLKRARHEWVADCFEASAEAARLIAAETDLIVPQPLPMHCRPADLPVQAYWRIELPTLAQLWPALALPARAAALRSLGALILRLHRLRAPGWGPLHQAEGPRDVAEDLDRDLRERLLPAVMTHWPEGTASLEALIAAIPSAARLHPRRAPALVHMDLHLGNVLCRVQDERVECIGFLDLDGAAGGAPESDIAGFDVLHSPLFQRAIDPALRHCVREGYGEPLDQRLIDYYRCTHLANQGFSSGLLEHDDHAAGIAAELKRRMRLLGPALAHTARLTGRRTAIPRLGTGSTARHAAACGTLPGSG